MSWNHDAGGSGPLPKIGDGCVLPRFVIIRASEPIYWFNHGELVQERLALSADQYRQLLGAQKMAARLKAIQDE
jgi:hypothetical protein